MRALVVLAVMTSVAVGDTAHRGPDQVGSGRVSGKVAVTEGKGTHVKDAVVIVYVVGFTEPPRTEAVTATIEQKNRRFVPDLVAITAGEAVQFPNRDPILHNVFSPSKSRKFDLGTFRVGESRSRTFSTAGVIDVFCNIHVEMAATILVLPNRAHVIALADGTYVIENVPPGKWTVFAYTRRMTKPASTQVTVSPGATATADFALLRGPEPAHENKYGEDYGDYK
jgi:plastocyanin